MPAEADFTETISITAAGSLLLLLPWWATTAEITSTT